MPLTMTERILARHAGRDQVQPGDNIWIDVDVLMTHDVCGPGTIGVFHQNFGRDAQVWDRDKVVIIPDHYIFTADKMANRNVDVLRQFVKEQNLPHYYDVGTDSYKGVCHIALPEEGHTRPGEVLLGTDSHTCTAGAFGEFATGIGNTDAGFVMGSGKLWVKAPPTMRFVFHGELPPYLMAKDLILAVIGDIGCDGATYRAMEFDGDGVFALNIEERMTLCNMAIEAGGKNGIFPFDARTAEYVDARTRLNGTPSHYEPVEADANQSFVYETVIDLSKLEPTVACHPDPGQRKRAKDMKDFKLDRAYVGSCTGGKTSDFVEFARVLRGRKVVIDTFGVPATPDIVRDLQSTRWGDKTIWQILEDAGVRMTENAGCAACLGGPVDTFGRMNQGGLRCISATNRNFPGRMGSKESEVYLASPATVAASALTGRVTDPRDYLAN
jgi:3-isopropylmalate/(R)-2-methylmalate dehydratase large subunit